MTTEAPNIADIRESLYFKLARNEQQSIAEIGQLADIDKDELAENVRRARKILKYQALAGTAAERDDAKQRSEAAQRALAAESPKIEAEIAVLLARKKKLHGEVTTSAALVDAQSNAVAQLRECLPPHRKQHHATSRSLFKQQPQFSRMRELQSRCAQIRGMDSVSEQGKIAYAETGHPELLDVRSTGPNSKMYSLNHDRWAAHVASLRAELPAIEKELAAIESEYTAGLAEIDRALDYYVPA